MRPILTDRTNLRLVHPANPDATIPAQRLVVTDHGGAPQAAITTTWQPDEREFKALANGAPVELTVLGPPLPTDLKPHDLYPDRDTFPEVSHPPVIVEPGDPPAAGGPVETLYRGHVDRMLGWLFAALNENPPPGAEGRGPFDYVLQRYESGGQRHVPAGIVLQIDGWIELCELAIEATRTPPGDGPSVGDLALPSSIRLDLPNLEDDESEDQPSREQRAANLLRRIAASLDDGTLDIPDVVNAVMGEIADCLEDE